MTSVGALISWSAICVTYIRFRKACLAQKVTVVEASRSPLQPALAYYGLVWSLFLSPTPLKILLILKLFFKDI